MLYGLLTDSIALYKRNVIRDAVTSMVKYDPHDATRSQFQQLRKPLKYPSTPRIYPGIPVPLRTTVGISRSSKRAGFYPHR